MYECFPGGLKSPRIVQEASNEATILTLVAQGMGVGFVVETARWRCPDGVAILKVADLKLSLPLALVWRKDNLSPLLSRFLADVGSLLKRRPPTTGGPALKTPLETRDNGPDAGADLGTRAASREGTDRHSTGRRVRRP